MTVFRAMAQEAAALANAPMALVHIADELEALTYDEHFTPYQHQRLTAILWALRLVPEGLKPQGKTR